MTKKQLKDKLADIADNFVYAATAYLGNIYDFTDINDLKNTPLQAFVDQIGRVLCENRTKYIVKFGGMCSIYDGDAIEADFAVAWLESDGSIELETFKLVSDY